MSWQGGREHMLLISSWRATNCVALSSRTSSLSWACRRVTSCCCSRKSSVTSCFSVSTFISWENLVFTHWDVCCSDTWPSRGRTTCHEQWYFIICILQDCVPVAQRESIALAAQNVVGSIPREQRYWWKLFIACKSLWIKASAKCMNVNVFQNIHCLAKTSRRLD